jgi:hypothetical protein
MEWLKKEWLNMVTIWCVTTGAIIQTLQQALTSSPKVAEMLPTLGGWWHYVPLILVVIAGISWRIGRSLKPTQHEQQGSALQTAVGMSIQAPVSFDATQYFRLSYHSDWTAEAEKWIRLAAQQNEPNDHEGFYAKFIGIGLVAYHHDIVWAYIFKSQFLMLMELT